AKAWHDPHLGSTTDEMLYIDGMTMARGHSTVTDQAFLWNNMLEIGYPIIKNIIQIEAFASATYLKKYLTKEIKKTDGWYYAMGAGFKLKIQGFPLGLYVVKDATLLQSTHRWKWLGTNDNSSRGVRLAFCISTSLI
ncbi:MAG: outer membrane protein assembly factor BamA, partial [Sphaerochaetaceae bacterium]|nr:outer membrane protein assembly factor BamA [Sphaerochaetaceae bacterium]